MPTVEQIRDWPGKTAVGPDEKKIGKVDHVYVDRQTGEPTFAAVSTGLFGTKDSLVPLEGASLHEDQIHLGFDKDKIKDAPNLDADEELSEQDESRLYEHYGIAGYSQYEGEEHETTRGQGYDTSGPNTDDAITRSEEELRVGTQSRETGRARLRKYVVTEQVQTTVPVSHEEVRVEREPITDANRGEAYAGKDLSEEEHEVVLHAEEPVVQKDVVAKERVRLDTETVTGEATVDETVRKEQVEVEGDAETGR